ncbi:LuxR family transcriptional regulator [Paraburkholderia sp. DHOC27]|uniref:LuxR family transcriptional regulator n=1 Tax=Paraburkholderia sp. DHOC27 TaxID=2303330 RepID=UPI000E3B96AA|nr:LuxR family transcriptional regulator [Paraburkholderia sp. DHOC27]RFU48560.1 LuxR family transcriptional regulator [Paraburkholderia sp. DHOC27]
MNDAVADESLPEQASDLAMDAAVALEQMHFGAARLLAQAALEVERRLAGAPIAVDLLPTCIIAQVLYEEGRLDDAEALLVARLPEIRADGTLAGALRAYGLLARVAASRRQYGRALVILHEADALAGQRDWSQLRAASLAQRIELCVASGRVDEAERCLSRLAALADQQDAQHGDAACEIERCHTVAQARLALTRAPLAVDVASLRQLHDETLRRRERYTSVWVALLLVEALLVSGQRDEAVERLSELLRLAPAVGMHQTLVDCTPCVAALMRAIVQRRVAPAGDISELLSYANVLLSRRQDGTVDADDVCAARRAPAAAGLSERERLIIGLMGQGLSNKQIAIQLSIAPETVKSHAKRVYSKLSVRNRTEAVTLASRLGLFPVPRSMYA